MAFTDAERAFLDSARLGRLATVDSSGAPQNNPVGFFYNERLGTVDIGGHNLAGTRKFRNVRAGSKVSLVVDSLVSVQPWTVRGIEIRGRAEALTDVDPPMRGYSRELIRIYPERVVSWGVDPDQHGMRARDI